MLYIIWYILLQLVHLLLWGMGGAEVTELSWDCVQWWMQPCFSIGLFLCKCQLLVLSCILCVTEPQDVGVAGDSFPPGLVTARPAFPASSSGLSATPVLRAPFSGNAMLLLPALNWFLMPGKDDSARQSSSFHLIPHEKGLGQDKVNPA